MKIDRLIGILAILLQQEKVTAPFLAEKFEVSRRTINRDIEDLCMAGIPLAAVRGAGGGIYIMEGYKIDRTVLTKPELQAILTGLKSLDSVSGTNKYRQLMDKLSAKAGSVYASDEHILIDLSSYYKTTLAPKIESIQKAIGIHRIISFDYYGPNGESKRQIEPYLLVFQWSSWYVWGYCRNRQGCRLFKLNRLQNLFMTGETFVPRALPEYKVEPEKAFPHNLEAVVVLEHSMKWRLIEEYGADSFTHTEDGKLLFSFGFTDKEHIFAWLLSFGDQAELLEPKELRVEFKALVENIGRKYTGT